MAESAGEIERPSVQTLDRGLRLLHLLAIHPDGLSVGELAAELEVHRAIVYRLLSTLAQHRLVVRGADGRHCLWIGLVELARAVIPQWRVVAVPELTALADEVGATAVLTVASEHSGMSLLVIEPRTTAMHVAYRPGTTQPLDSGAAGKAILAGRPAQPGEPDDVAAARSRGYATSRGEPHPGAIGVAAPIVVDGWADASVAIISLVEIDEAGIRSIVDAAERIARAFPGSANASLSAAQA